MHDDDEGPTVCRSRLHLNYALRDQAALLVRGLPVNDEGMDGAIKASRHHLGLHLYKGPSSVQGANRCLHLVLGSACMGFPVLVAGGWLLVGSWLAVCGFLANEVSASYSCWGDASMAASSWSRLALCVRTRSVLASRWHGLIGVVLVLVVKWLIGWGLMGLSDGTPLVARVWMGVFGHECCGSSGLEFLGLVGLCPRVSRL